MSSSPSFLIVCNLPRVTIVGACRVGSTLAQRVAEKNLADVVLLDIITGYASRFGAGFDGSQGN